MPIKPIRDMIERIEHFAKLVPIFRYNVLGEGHTSMVIESPILIVIVAIDQLGCI